MPAVSEKQRRYMGAELARKRAGKRTKTGMTEGQLEDFATMKKPKSHMPKGASLSPSGDIAAKRGAEADKVAKFKRSGRVMTAAGKFGSIGK